YPSRHPNEFEQGERRFSTRLPAKGIVVVQHVQSGLWGDLYISESDREGPERTDRVATPCEATGLRRVGDRSGRDATEDCHWRDAGFGGCVRSCRSHGDNQNQLQVARTRQLELSTLARRGSGADQRFSSRAENGF